MSTRDFQSRKAATIKDVAARSGVSYQTVSRVVNGSPHVKRETRVRVAAALAELQYRPNNAARHLVSRRSGVIGFVGSITFYGPARIMATNAAGPLGDQTLPPPYHGAICPSQGAFKIVRRCNDDNIVDNAL